MAGIRGPDTGRGGGRAAPGTGNAGPVIVECKVAPDENVYPMVAPGKGIHQMEGVKP